VANVRFGDGPKEGILVNPEPFGAAFKSISAYSFEFVEETILNEIKTRYGQEFSEIENFSDIEKEIRKATTTLKEELT